MKHYIIAPLSILAIVATILILNKNLISVQNDADMRTKEGEEHVGQLADISQKLAAISLRLSTLGDRIANLEYQQYGAQQPLQTNSAREKILAASVADDSAREGEVDSELALLAQATGVTTAQLAAMNGSEIETLNEKQMLEQDQRYFKQLEQHFYSGKPETFDRAFEQSITDSVNVEELSNSKVSNISCDNAMCRVEVKHSDPDAMNKFLDKVPGLSLWSTEAIVDFPEAGDKPTSIIYLARKGHSLPVRSAQTQ